MIARLVIMALLVLAPFASPLAASAATAGSTHGSYALAASGTGVVRVVYFWMQGCGHCATVKATVLPPLREKYGSKLEIIEVEVSNAETSNRLDRAAAALGFSAGSVGVPFMVIGDKGLMGSLQIPNELPGLIEKYLAAGGVDVAAIPGLEGIASVAGATGGSAAATPAQNGFVFAWAVLLLLLAALAYAAYMLVRFHAGRSAPRGPAWTNAAFLLLCVAGIGVAAYLSYVEVAAKPAVCGPVGDCNAVQSSPYAKLFGVLPVGVLGLIGYFSMIAAWLWPRLRRDAIAAYAPFAVLAMAAFGVAYSTYLTLLELFVIHAVCAWCLASAVIMAILLVVSANLALQRKQAPKAEKARTKAQTWKAKKRR
jgi:uncharacterized membrane protein/glutaredoxin